MSKLEKQIAVLSQPRHLDMISRRIKLINGELEKLNELKSGKAGDANHGADQANSNAISDNMEEKVNVPSRFSLCQQAEY